MWTVLDEWHFLRRISTQWNYFKRIRLTVHILLGPRAISNHQQMAQNTSAIGIRWSAKQVRKMRRFHAGHVNSQFYETIAQRFSTPKGSNASSCTRYQRSKAQLSCGKMNQTPIFSNTTVSCTVRLSTDVIDCVFRYELSTHTQWLLSRVSVRGKESTCKRFMLCKFHK